MSPLEKITPMEKLRAKLLIRSKTEEDQNNSGALPKVHGLSLEALSFQGMPSPDQLEGVEMVKIFFKSLGGWNEYQVQLSKLTTQETTETEDNTELIYKVSFQLENSEKASFRKDFMLARRS